MKQDIYSSVTNNLIEAIENIEEGDTFEMPWHKQAVVPVNALTGKFYRGVNTVSLWVAQMANGYSSAHWATYKQWKELGAQVRKGEKSSLIVFWSSVEVEPEKDNEEKESRMFARASFVFNASQVDGWEAPVLKGNDGLEGCTAAEKLVAASGAVVKHGMAGAYYHRSEDYIGMPDQSTFKSTTHRTANEGYFSTLLHEITHWSGAEHRLNRIKGKKFGDKEYAFEELTAELGAAMLCAQTGLTSSPRKDHALYLKSWLKALQNDKRYIFQAASQAQKAVDYLCGFVGEAEREAA